MHVDHFININEKVMLSARQPNQVQGDQQITYIRTRPKIRPVSEMYGFKKSISKKHSTRGKSQKALGA